MYRMRACKASECITINLSVPIVNGSSSGELAKKVDITISRM